METATKFILPGALYILTLAAGVWVSQTGRPLNTLIFTIHKLIALAAVVVTAVQGYGLLKGVNVQTLVVALVVLTGVCVLALFATGALLSASGPVNVFLLTIHRAAPFLAALSMAAAVYLFVRRSI